MKALNQLNNVEKGRLLHQLFAGEMPALLDFVQGMCEAITENQDLNRAKWSNGLFSFDFWLSQVRRNFHYEQTFLQMDATQARGSKSIYLSPEHHERLTRIVQVIIDDRIPLFAYLNNILDHHFGVFEDAISKEYKEKYKALF